MGSYYWPWARWGRLWDCTALTAAMAFADDVIDAMDYETRHVALDQWHATAEERGAFTLDEQCDQLVKRLARGFGTYLAPTQFERLIGALKEPSYACVEAARRAAEGTDLDSFNAYMELRRDTNGYAFHEMLIEMTLEVDMSGIIGQEPMRGLLAYDAERLTALDGLMTITKGLSEGTDSDNLVFVLAGMRGITSLQEAVDAAFDFAREAEKRYRRQARVVLDSTLGNRDDVRRFVSGLDGALAGLIAVLPQASRYSKPGG
ncbi:terpene synthase family protein [Streptomyces sp. NPDC101150]|uniref:terpene synthase family protein n=1 Tax=Streptomyces sp. NPDC101150 TaxID=3366114 RepID=UPI003828A562